MSCMSCTKPFSLLRKEKGCPNCGFSYCSKCLDNKVFVRKLNSEAKVCLKCKNNLSNEKPNSNKITPPDTYFKRLAEVENKSINDTATRSTSSNPLDNQILERLHKLKEDKVVAKQTELEINERLKSLKGDIPTATDDEIQARLSRLRGLPETSSNKPVLQVKDLRTEQEQVEDLMKQYLQQNQLDSNYKNDFDSVISDIESRVQKLKSDVPTPVPTSSNIKEAVIESEDEEETVHKIVEKIKKEVSLEEYQHDPINDELPFCEICNEDARMRCLGCRYLFCKRCFLDHKDDDDGCDRYETYQPPKGTSY